jgi:hypothetical protein
MTVNLKAAMEGLGHLDPELQFIAIELATLHVEKRRAAGQPVRVGEQAVSYCPAVADLVAERLGTARSSQRLTPAEASLIGTNALTTLDPKQELSFNERVELAPRFVVAAAKLRAISPVSHEGLRDDYWPFGMEGGFCNPHKVNELMGA